MRLIVKSLALLVLALPTYPVSGQTSDHEALLRLNRQLLESVFVRQDTAVISVTALPNFLVVPPGGIVENRAQFMSGFRNTAMDSVRIDDERVAVHSGTAVVIARVVRLGPARDAVATGRLRIMSVFVSDQGQWRLLARSVTPCIERAVTAGRC